MRLQRENGTLLLNLNAAEARLMRRIFRQLADHYRPPPAELDPKTNAALYSTRGCASAKMSDEETREWIGQLHALKSVRLAKLEDWSRQLATDSSGGFSLRVTVDDAPAFISSINDHRLLAAARHEIGQAEMDVRWPWQMDKLPVARQEALLEIHFLAWVIEEALRAMQEA
jgi:hypothetical protein